MTQTPITQLADFLADLRHNAIPDNIAFQARLCLLDTLGCMIAGAGTEDAKRLLRAETVTNPGKICSVAGGGRHSLLGAARINAYQGDIFELNDLIAGHASIGIVAAALSLAQARKASGKTLQMAIIAGIETSNRVYNAFYPYQKPLDEVGIVSVGMVSSIGAAAACAHILDLDTIQITNALAIAAGWANWCPAEVIFGDGGSAKPMLFGGLPAAAGITAALAAAEGLTGPHGILTSDKGFFATVATQWNEDAFRPDNWALAAPRRKLHACCGYIHSAYDSIEKLVASTAFAPSDVASVTVEVPVYTLPAIRKPALPSTPNEARFHMQYMLAHALTGAAVVTPEMSSDFVAEFARPEIKDLTARVSVVGAADLTHYHQSRVTINRKSGAPLTAANAAPRGSAQNPLGEAALISKFTGLSSPVLGAEPTARLASHCLGVERLATLRDFCTLMEAKSS